MCVTPVFDRLLMETTFPQDLSGNCFVIKLLTGRKS